MKKILLLTLFAVCACACMNGCASTWDGIKEDSRSVFKPNSTTCPFCGAVISKNASVCYKCKRQLPEL